MAAKWFSIAVCMLLFATIAHSDVGTETPHILAFKDGWITQGGFGTLSPNKRWYAVLQATFNSETSNCYGGYAQVT